MGQIRVETTEKAMGMSSIVAEEKLEQTEENDMHLKVTFNSVA